jgi:hypothetical protein
MLQTKQLLSSVAVVLLAAASARAGLYTDTFSSGSSVGVVPAGNPVGAVFGGVVSGVPAGLTVGSVTVNLQLSGGYNGNLCAFLVAPNGTTVVLMNQPGVAVNGFGATGAGMNITLSDAGSSSVQSQTGSGTLSATYSAVGTLGSTYGSAADGTWDLYFADTTSGGGTSTLTQWSLNITSVPEPVDLALGILALLAFARWGFVKGRQAGGMRGWWRTKLPPCATAPGGEGFEAGEP